MPTQVSCLAGDGTYSASSTSMTLAVGLQATATSLTITPCQLRGGANGCGHKHAWLSGQDGHCHLWGRHH